MGNGIETFYLPLLISSPLFERLPLSFIPSNEPFKLPVEDLFLGIPESKYLREVLA